MTQMKIVLIQGDRSPTWHVKHFDESKVQQDLTGYTCRLTIDGTTIDREVTLKTQDNKNFVAYLTPADTDGLTPGEYVIGIKLSKLPAFSSEQQITLILRPKVAPAV